METVTLVFNAQMLNVVIEALHSSPYKVAAPVLQMIDNQIKEQMKPKEEKV
jgi:hypothetical protein